MFLYRPIFCLLVIIGLFFVGCAGGPDATKTESHIGAIQDGWDVNRPDAGGYTPLMRAAAENRVGAIKQLLDAGADIYDRTPDGATAIDLAYQASAFDAFKLLLENGAVASLDLAFGKYLDASDPRKRFFAVLEEFPLYSSLRTTARGEEIIAFDRYFSSFSSGMYRNDAEALFYAFLNHHIQTIEENRDQSNAQSMKNHLEEMGTRLFKVTASALNIRQDNTLRAPIVGKYEKGESVYAEHVGDQWVRTDQGWVSKRHLVRIGAKIPEIDIYMERLAAIASSRTDLTKKTRHSKKRGNTSPKPVTGSQPNRFGKELDRIMETPDKAALEQFILDYRDNPNAAGAVRRAKDAYKQILLSD